MSMKRILIIVGVLFVIGAVTGAGLYVAFPNQMSIIGGLTRNYFLSWSAPAGTTTTESNASYKGAEIVAASPAAGPPTSAEVPSSSATGDWPSYNRTLDSDRYSPLSQITTQNASKL